MNRKVKSWIVGLMLLAFSAQVLAVIAPANIVKGSNATAETVTTASATTSVSGSTFLIFVSWYKASGGATFVSATDSKGNTYTQILTELNLNDVAISSRVYYCQNCTGGTSHTFTATTNSDTVGMVVYGVEVTGGLTTGILDQSARVRDGASPFTSPGITTTQADELLLSFIFGDSGSNPATTAESTGFTIQSSETNGATFVVNAIATRVVSSISTYTPSWTQSGSTEAGVWVISLKAITGGGGGVVVNPLSGRGSSTAAQPLILH